MPGGFLGFMCKSVSVGFHMADSDEESDILSIVESSYYRPFSRIVMEGILGLFIPIYKERRESHISPPLALPIFLELAYAYHIYQGLLSPIKDDRLPVFFQEQ